MQIIAAAAVRVAQCAIGKQDIPHAFLRVLALIHIRVILKRQVLEGFFNHLARRICIHTQHCVVISKLFHRLIRYNTCDTYCLLLRRAKARKVAEVEKAGYVSFLCARKSFIPICEFFLRSCASESALLEEGRFTTSCRISTASFMPLPGLRNRADNRVLISAC